MLHTVCQLVLLLSVVKYWIKRILLQSFRDNSYKDGICVI